jgi:hypothetical protein
MSNIMIPDNSEGMSLADAKHEAEALDCRLETLGLKNKIDAISKTISLDGLMSGSNLLHQIDGGFKLVTPFLFLNVMGPLTKYFLKVHREKKLKKLNLLDQGSKGVIELILQEEELYSRKDNFLVPVIMGSVLLEKSLTQLVANPAREVSDELIKSQLKYNKKFKVGSLEGWRDGKTGSSLSIIVQILYGLKNGLNQKRELIKSFINRHFLPEYEQCLMDTGMMMTLQAVRNQYRNPACHLIRDSFCKEDYEDLSIKITGNKSFTEWLNKLSNKKKEPNQALLHNHIVLRRVP